MKNLSIVVALFAVSGAFASGFVCQGEDGFKAKLYNKTTGATRTPAVMVVSHEDADPATLVKAAGAEIRKRNRANSVQYITDGNSRIGADTVILQISHLEGRETLEEGEVVDGQLILVSEDRPSRVFALECERYLKND